MSLLLALVMSELRSMDGLSLVKWASVFEEPQYFQMVSVESRLEKVHICCLSQGLYLLIFRLFQRPEWRTTRGFFARMGGFVLFYGRLCHPTGSNVTTLTSISHQRRLTAGVKEILYRKT